VPILGARNSDTCSLANQWILRPNHNAVDFAAPMLDELDDAARELNISWQRDERL
jgi:hypothetical protein